MMIPPMSFFFNITAEGSRKPSGVKEVVGGVSNAAARSLIV